MHWFDVGVTVLVLLLGVWGLWRGLIREVMSLAGFIAAFVLSARGYPYVALALGNVITVEWARQAISVALIFVVVMLLAAVLSRLLRLMLQVIGLSLVERFLGGVFGVLKVTLIVSSLLIVSSKFLPTFTKQLGAESALAPLFFHTANMLAIVLEQKDYDAFKQMSQQALQPLRKLISTPQTVPAIVDTLLPQPSATPAAPAVPSPKAPSPTAPAPPAAKPQSLQLATPQESLPAGTPPAVAHGPAAPQEPASADSPSGISDADSKALEKMLHERLKERRR